jgi:succinate dehydrogenase / fumarate reductase, membrane anchor subunit
MVNKQPVGAHYGWREWLAQRVTAVIMAVFSLVIFAFFFIKGSVGYAEWKELFGSQLFRILSLLFLLSMYYHAWIGIRDVLMDYVKPVSIRLSLQVLVLLALFGFSIWSVAILWAPAQSLSIPV